MNPLFITLVVLVSIIALVVAGAVLLLLGACWVASGSPDVNGDPERDGGWSEDEIQAMSRHWDHGSLRTHRVPDLETARQLNRLHLAREVRSIRNLNRI